jgi:transcriptional regulator with XRE-family HTH domain
MPALPLTKEQLDDAARLKEHFLKWQKRQKEAGLLSSQEAASEQLGFNQSSMSQYLNGKIPLNVDAATKFAELMGCRVSDLSPAIAEQAAKYAQTLGAENGALPGRKEHEHGAPDHPRPEAGGAKNRLQVVETLSTPKLQWVTEQEAELLSEFRACEERQKQSLLVAARGLPKATAVVAARDKA